MSGSQIVPITSRVERARGRNRREALNTILSRLASLRPHAVKCIAEQGGCKLYEMQHASLTLWFSWFDTGLNVAVYDAGVRVFSITFDPNNLATARPMGWKRGDWEARIFLPVDTQ